MDYYRHLDQEAQRDEYGKALLIDYFVEHHLHFGWYPQVRLDTVQKEILGLLMSGPQVLTLTASEDQLKWPMAAYLVHNLLYTPGQRVTIVASTQREANRRFQGLLYPYDSLPQSWHPQVEMRTCQELHLETGNYVKTFTVDTKKHIAEFKPDVLIVEDAQVGAVNVKDDVRVIHLNR